MKKEYTYKDAGVDIDAGNRAVGLMGPLVRETFRPEVLTDIGGFGGLFALDVKKYKEPVLVSATDGVGTKLKIAFLLDKHDTIGVDCVAMCVNDLLVTGAEPLFFLDYLAVGNLHPEKVAEIVSGVAAGCKQAGCALIGGETAEMPDFYAAGEYDLAGFSVGVVDKDKVIDGGSIKEGDVVVGLPSLGMHSNGYSLARKVFFNALGWQVDRYVPELGKTLGEELLEPTKIYVNLIKNIDQKVKIKGMAHITGGGLKENLARILPAGIDVSIKRSTITPLPIFSLLAEAGGISEEEMYRTFNMGVGFCFLVAQDEMGTLREAMQERGENFFELGHATPGTGQVTWEEA